MLPLPKTLLEGLFWNGVHLRHRVLHYLFSALKTGSFQCHLQFRKQPEVARIHVWSVGRLVVCGQPYRVLASLVLELHWRRGDVGGKAPPLRDG